MSELETKRAIALVRHESECTLHDLDAAGDALMECLTQTERLKKLTTNARAGATMDIELIERLRREELTRASDKIKALTDALHDTLRAKYQAMPEDELAAVVANYDLRWCSTRNYKPSIEDDIAGVLPLSCQFWFCACHLLLNRRFTRRASSGATPDDTYSMRSRRRTLRGPAGCR